LEELSRRMKLALVCDTFPPLKTSGAVQLYDLAVELHIQGHEVTVISPSAEYKSAWIIKNEYRFKVLILHSFNTKDVNHIRRAIAEFLMPYCMIFNFYRSPLANELWDGIVWYSPSIFFGPFIKYLKKRKSTKSYLIIRDIFPEWAADLGIISRRGVLYHFLSLVANNQYSVADTIGIQSPGNYTYFKRTEIKFNSRVEVLHNWLSGSKGVPGSIVLSDTKLANRRIFIYAGNMGVAQGVQILLDLALHFKSRNDVGFVFVGRGSKSEELKNFSVLHNLDNVLFLDEVHPNEIPQLYAQCVAGLLSLDPRHKSHNIPGKFLSYMEGGIPVLGSVNSGNDLVGIVQRNNVGRIIEDGSTNSLFLEALELLRMAELDPGINVRCRELFLQKYTSEIAARQIISALN